MENKNMYQVNEKTSITEPIYSSDQANTLYYQCITPSDEVEVRATLLIVHGMCEHSERYLAFAQFLASQGIAVMVYDQLGHGKTAKNDGHLGFFQEDYPAQALLKDVVIMADRLQQEYPNLPHFIMGHSMGSFIVRNVLSHHSHRFSGAILMGTADQDLSIKALLPISKVLNKVAPHHKNALFGKTMNTLLNAKLQDNLYNSPFSWISDNVENIQAYESDPLCGFDFTNNGFMALFSLMDKAINQKWYANIQRDFPLLLVSGEDDPVGNMGKGIRRLKQRLSDQGFSNVSMYLYANMRHEPLQEKEKQMAYEDILQWLTIMVAV